MHESRDVVRSVAPPLLAAAVVALLVGLPPDDPQPAFPTTPAAVAVTP